MTAPTGKIAPGQALDQPIFDPGAFRLDDEQAAVIATARELGQSVFAGRAAAYDRDAKFPTENYRDLHRSGLLGIARGGGGKASRGNPLCPALPAKADGVSVVGDWDPLGMRGTVSRTLLFKDVFVAEDAALMPRGVYFQAGVPC